MYKIKIEKLRIYINTLRTNKITVEGNFRWIYFRQQSAIENRKKTETLTNSCSVNAVVKLVFRLHFVRVLVNSMIEKKLNQLNHSLPSIFETSISLVFLRILCTSTHVVYSNHATRVCIIAVIDLYVAPREFKNSVGQKDRQTCGCQLNTTLHFV